MRHIVFGLVLVPLIACGDVWADEAQVPNANAANADVPNVNVPNANAGGSQQAQANEKLPNRKRTSIVRSRGPSAPVALPLSSAEAYASGHPANLAISSVPKPAPAPGNSWTGFYVGGGVGAAQP
jgi:hypothetical protein